MTGKVWTTKDGKKIPYSKLEDGHLLNILKFVEKRSKELDGEIIEGGGSWGADDIYYEKGTEGEWLQKFGYYGLRKEAEARALVTPLT